MINFEDPQEEVNKLDFSDEIERAPLSDEVIQEKKKVLKYATQGNENLKFDEASLDYIYRTSGEDTIRHIMAQEDLIRKSELKNQVIGDLLQQGDVSPEVVQTVSSLSAHNFTSPENIQKSARDIIERKFAERVTLDAFSRESFEEGDEEVLDAMDITENMVTKTTLLKNLLAEEGALFQEKSFLGKAGSIGITMIPFVSWIGTNRAFDGEYSSSFFQGNNQAEQVAAVWGIQDPNEFIQVIKTEYQERKKEYGQAFAINWLNAFLNYGSNDKLLDNIFSGIDLATAGTGAVAKSYSLGKGIIKGVSRESLDVGEIATQVGDLKATAFVNLAENGVKQLPRGWDKVKSSVESLTDFEKFIGDTDKVAQAAINRITLAAKNRAAKISDIYTSGRGIDTVSPEELSQLAEQAFEDVTKTYTNVQHNLLDVDFAGISAREVVEAQDTASNLNELILRFGRSNGTLFESKKGAENWVKQYSGLTDDFEIKQKGSRYFVELRKYVREDNVSKVQLPTKAQTPVGTLGIRDWVLSGVRSDSYVVSAEQVGDRAVVTSQIEAMARLIEPLAEPIKALTKKQQDQWSDILEYGSTQVGLDGKPGKWFTVDELVSAYNHLHGRTPTEKEIDAYYSFIQINDFEYLIRDLNYTKQLARDGFENISLRIGSEDVPFVGRVLDNVEFGDEYFSFKVLDDAGEIVARGDNKSFNKAKLQSYLDQGYRIIQPASGTLKIGEETATLVVTKVAKRNQLTLQQVQYRAGGHKIHESPHYIKVPDIHVTDNGTRIYRGDLTIANASTAKQAAQIAEHLRNIGESISRGDLTAARRYIADNLPNQDIDQVIDWFESGKIPKNGKITATRAGQRILDQDTLIKGVDFDHDGTANAFNYLSQISGRFVGQRDATDIGTIISQNGSLSWNHQAQKLRPLQSLNEGLKEATRGYNMDDYLRKSADRYVREFLPILDNVSEKEFRRNPIYYLTNPVFKAGARPEEVAAAKKFAQAVKNMLGQQTEISTKLDVFKDKIIDWAFDKGGPKSKLYKVASERLLPTIEDPTVFFRSIAFHTKLGLFNPKQLFLQSQILTNISSIMPKEAFPALAAHNLSYGLFLNPRPNMLKEADARLAKFGWQKGWFEEAHKAGLDSGWFDVGGDAAVLDKLSDPSLTKGAVGSFLDTGLAFFKKGEQIGRVTAWHAAYLAWKKANPTKTLRRQDMTELMVRARDLTANMTRDQNAWWQRGIASVPTQFWGFQMRMMEQLISPRSRLTRMERARLFAGISLMYGVDVGFGSGVGVWPIHEEVKKYLMESGLNEIIDENIFLETLRDGILSTSIEMLTGVDFDTKSFGPAGLPAIKDLVRQDGDWYDIFGGASASIIMDILSGAMPFLEINRSVEPDVYNVIDVLKNVSTVNNAVKLYKALNTGKWLTNNETYLGDISAQEAWISAITGLELERFTNAFITLEASRDVKASVDSAIKDVTKEFSRANMARENGDYETFESHVQRAEALAIAGGLSPSQISLARRRGMQLDSLDEKAKDQFSKIVIERQERMQRIKEGNQ